MKNKELGVISTALMSPALSCLKYGFLDVYFILCLIHILLYRKEINKFFRKQFLFKNVLLVYFLSSFLSTFFTPIHHVYILFTVIIEALYVMVFWIAALKIKNQISILNTIIYLSIIVSIYGLFTFITNFNPYINITVSEGINAVDNQVEMIRFGRQRIQSIFAYVETLGGFCVMMISLGCIYFKEYGIDSNKRMKIVFMIVMLFITCFLTSSRSQIAGMAVVLFLFFIEIKSKAKFLVIPIIAILILYIGYFYLNEFVNSFSGESLEGGSSKAMRLNQLAISFYYMLNANNVLIGNGLGYANQAVVGVVSGMAGAESIWFRYMIDQGFLGVFFLTYLFLYSIKQMFKLYKPFILIPMAYMIIRTMAVVPDMPVTYICFIIILANRLLNNKGEDFSLIKAQLCSK